MPITHQQPLQPIGQAAFKQLDYKVMGLAFELHRELGQLFDESIYQTALTQVLSSKEISTLSEFHIQVTHRGFSKDYYVDLMVDQSLPYELKTCASLNASHTYQLLNYLLLANLQHGKLLNFKAPSVEGRFVSTTLGREDRQHYTIRRSN